MGPAPMPMPADFLGSQTSPPSRPRPSPKDAWARPSRHSRPGPFAERHHPVLQATLARIADDEQQHAALSGVSPAGRWGRAARTSAGPSPRPVDTADVEPGLHPPRTPGTPTSCMGSPRRCCATTRAGRARRRDHACTHGSAGLISGARRGPEHPVRGRRDRGHRRRHRPRHGDVHRRRVHAHRLPAWDRDRGGHPCPSGDRGRGCRRRRGRAGRSPASAECR